MIRTACLAVLATGALLTSQGASATVNLNDRISQIVKGLHNAHFSSRDFSFTASVGRPSLFTGIEGVRLINGNDLIDLNEWANDLPSSNNVFNGGDYKFTHGVLGSFFDDQKKPEDKPVNPVFNGAPYKFTHEVLDSFFESETNDSDAPVQQALLIEPPLEPVVAKVLAPIPEPASWAMMIGGFALAGAALRNRRVVAVRAA